MTARELSDSHLSIRLILYFFQYILLSAPIPTPSMSRKPASHQWEEGSFLFVCLVGMARFVIKQPEKRANQKGRQQRNKSHTQERLNLEHDEKTHSPPPRVQPIKRTQRRNQEAQNLHLGRAIQYARPLHELCD